MGASLSELIQEYYVTDEWMNNVRSSKFEFYCSVQVDTIHPSLSNPTLMDQLNATDSSPCMCRLSSLACLTLVCSDRLPVSLAPALQSSSSPFLSLQTHSVDSSALSYTVRSPPSHLVMFSRSTAQNIKETSARVQFKKVCVPSILFVQSI